MNTKLRFSFLLVASALALAACAPVPIKVAEAPSVAPPPSRPAVNLLLAYHRALDGLSQADLNKELTALNSAPTGAETEVRKAMVLEDMHDGTKLARARAILATVLLMDDADALSVRPLVEWMMNNETEMRRLSVLNERQGLQLKESQHRFDQLNDKLEAMKRIESSQPASPIEIAPAN